MEDKRTGKKTVELIKLALETPAAEEHLGVEEDQDWTDMGSDSDVPLVVRKRENYKTHMHKQPTTQRRDLRALEPMTS